MWDARAEVEHRTIAHAKRKSGPRATERALLGILVGKLDHPDSVFDPAKSLDEHLSNSEGCRGSSLRTPEKAEARGRLLAIWVAHLRGITDASLRRAWRDDFREDWKRDEVSHAAWSFVMASLPPVALAGFEDWNHEDDVMTTLPRGLAVRCLMPQWANARCDCWSAHVCVTLLKVGRAVADFWYQGFQLETALQNWTNR